MNNAVNWTIDHLIETDSTNGWLREHRTEADRVVWADYQTAGRGCGTNSWESERGKNLLFSVLIHPKEVRAADQFILSMANALALKDTLDDYVDGVKIKWPNDLYWKDCKICGTLIETTLQGSFVKDCIIGTGINVNQSRFLSDAPNPVSLCQILGRDTDCCEVLRKVLDNIAKYMDRVGGEGDLQSVEGDLQSVEGDLQSVEGDLQSPVSARTANWEAIRAHYRSHLYRREETWPYRFADGSVKQCKLVNVTDDGHLELLHSSGEVWRFAFKEVQFEI